VSKKESFAKQWLNKQLFLIYKRALQEYNVGLSKKKVVFVICVLIQLIIKVFKETYF